MPIFRFALLAGERATVEAVTSIGEEDAVSAPRRRGLSSRKDGDDDSQQERGKSSSAKPIRVESEVAASALGSSNGWGMHCWITIPPPFLDTTRHRHTAIQVIRHSIGNWVKERGKVGFVDARCSARTCILQCIIHGIDQDMATNPLQSQSYLQNQLQGRVEKLSAVG